MGRRARWAAIIALALVAGIVIGVALDRDDGRSDESRVVDELLRVERRKATIARGGYERFADLLPLVRGRGFPLVVVGRVVEASPAIGYGPVTLPCEPPSSGTADCAGATEWQVLPLDDGRAAEVVLRATIEIDEVLAHDSTDPTTVHVEWIVSGPATPSPVDPQEVADALEALGPAVWVLTEPGSNATYASDEDDPELAGIAWPPFGIARLVDGERVEPIAGPIPASLDTLAELRRALRHPREP